MTVFLTLDVGGSSTRAIVHDADGTVHGYGRAGGGNVLTSVPVASAALASAARAALAQAGHDASDVDVAFAAAAGSRSGATGFDGGLKALGVRPPLDVTTDLLAMFCAGTSAADGMALLVGTGAAAVAVRGGALDRVVDGRGWLLGDGGSGFWIAREVGRAVIADLDGFGPPTALTAQLLAVEGIAADLPAADQAQALVEIARTAGAPGIARWAPLALQAMHGDPVAREIVVEAAHSLARSLTAAGPVGGRPLVLGGGVIHHAPHLRQLVLAELDRDAQPSEVIAVADGLPGAATLALRSVGRSVDAALHARLCRAVEAATTAGPGSPPRRGDEVAGSPPTQDGVQ